MTVNGYIWTLAAAFCAWAWIESLVWLYRLATGIHRLCEIACVGTHVW